MKEETRGIIEREIDRLAFGYKNEEIEAIQETTPIENTEEFLLGHTLGYLRRFGEFVVLMQEGKLTKTDDKTITRILLTRLPEIRKKLMRHLNK